MKIGILSASNVQATLIQEELQQGSARQGDLWQRK